MRQAEMDLLLAKGEYEVRSYFLCGASARTNNVDGTTMFVTNKRIVLEFMNHFEVSRKEIPIDQILFVRSHYYEEEEDPSFAYKCRNVAISAFVLAIAFIAVGVLALANIFNVFSLLGLSISWLPFIPIGLGVVLCVLGGIFIDKAKKFKPRVGKKLELLIGTTLDYDKGLGFTTDSTKSLRDNMRTYSGTPFNSLVGSVELNPTREAKKMVNELGALIIDIKAGMYDEDPAIREKRERELKEKKRREEEAKKALEREQESLKNKKEVQKEERRKPQENKYDLKKDREERMAKYGKPIEEDEYSNLPLNMQAAYRKAKVQMHPTKTKKTEDELLEEEYLAVIKSLNLD